MASWWLNQDYIARVLCINRDKPQLHCNGKCHLAKQLRAANDAEQKQQPLGGKQVFQEITLFCAPLLPVQLPLPAVLWSPQPKYAPLCVSKYAWDRLGPDHPPAEG